MQMTSETYTSERMGSWDAFSGLWAGKRWEISAKAAVAGTNSAVRWGFFFSSRRRHTRLTCDWSSDVCSSDLAPLRPLPLGALRHAGAAAELPLRRHGEPAADLPHPDDAGARPVARGAHRPRAGAQIGRASCRERG